MKKLLKVLGFLAAFVMAMFLNTSAMDSNKSVKFNLADVISLNSANAECPFWDPFCIDPRYDGETEEPYWKPCTVCVDYYGTTCWEENKEAIDCIWVSVPLLCLPYDPC